MKAFWICLALMLAAGTASAQMYKWVDKDGKVRYGDTPPPGVKAASIKSPQSAGGAPAAAAAPAGAKKGPLTAAEQEQEYRKRQKEAEKNAQKSEQERQAKSATSEGCERTREYLRTLESGQRIARTNSSGERYYMNDDQVAQEIAKTQQSIQGCK